MSELPIIDQLDAEFSTDPEYVAEGLALDFAEHVCRVLQDKGMTQEDLAQEMNVPYGYITRVMNAPPNLSLRSIAAIGIALGVKIQIWVEGQND